MEVSLWIIATQISRRNLTSEQLVYYRGKQYEMEKKATGAPKENTNSVNQRGNNCHFDLQNIPEKTSKRLAEQHNVSERTIRDDAHVTKAVDKIGETSLVAKQKILAGEVGINKKDLIKLASKPKEELAALAENSKLKIIFK